MTYKIKACESLCELDIFEINGIKAYYEDFGDWMMMMIMIMVVAV